MARAAVKAKQAERRAAQPPKAQRKDRGRRKHAGGGNPNQQLFFQKLRRRAKFMYVLLAVIFAATFAFLGIGSGSGGLSQLFQNINLFGGGGTSVSSALSAVKKNPNDPKALRKLATAYEAKNDTPDAITYLQQYLNIKTKDAKAWGELGGLQLSNAQTFVTQYRQAATTEQLAAPSAVFAPTANSSLSKALGSNPIETASAGTIQGTLNDLSQRANLGFQNAVSSYQKVTSLQPGNSNAWLQLASAAQTAGNATTAVQGYRKYLQLNPNSPSAAQIRALIKQLGGK